MNADKSLGFYLKHKPDPRMFQEEASLPLSNKYIGIEIEAENVPFLLEDVSQKLLYWGLEIDGSLRNFGAEFITRKLRGKDIILALSELEETLNKYKITPEYSARTSVHVHVDCRYMVFNQLRSLTLLYAIYEPLLFAYVGLGRDKSNYCVPYYSNPRGLWNLSRMFSSTKAEEVIIRDIVKQGVRYEAMNIKSLEKHGTLEFRHHFGTHDKDVLLPWIRALLYIFKQAKSMHYLDILTLFEKQTYAEFTEELNTFLKVHDLQGCEEKAIYSIGSILTYSIPTKENP